MAKVCAASPNRRDVNRTELPSGVKLAGFSSAPYQVSRFASPPRAGATKIFIGPKRSEAKAIISPEGDQTGEAA